MASMMNSSSADTPHISLGDSHAEFIDLPGVSHFAPLQRPAQFNSAMRAFLGKVLA
jgi:pimeloyl-ACP methyl ester carboxylesterase